MQIEVSARLTTCHYYRFEGGEFCSSLESFILLLSACFFLGWFGWVFEGKSVMSISGIQACSALRHDVASVCGRFLQRGFTRKWFAHPIRQNGIGRKRDRGRFAGCYLLSVAAVFRMSGSCIHAMPAISSLFHLDPYCSRLHRQRFTCNYVYRRKQ